MRDTAEHLHDAPRCRPPRGAALIGSGRRQGVGRGGRLRACRYRAPTAGDRYARSRDTRGSGGGTVGWNPEGTGAGDDPADRPRWRARRSGCLGRRGRPARRTGGSRPHGPRTGVVPSPDSCILAVCRPGPFGPRTPVASPTPVPATVLAAAGRPGRRKKAEGRATRAPRAGAARGPRSRRGARRRHGRRAKGVHGGEHLGGWTAPLPRAAGTQGTGGGGRTVAPGVTWVAAGSHTPALLCESRDDRVMGTCRRAGCGDGW